MVSSSQGSPVPANRINFYTSCWLRSFISIDNWQLQSCLIPRLMIAQWGGSAQTWASKKALEIRSSFKSSSDLIFQLAIGDCKPFVFQDYWCLTVWLRRWDQWCWGHSCLLLDGFNWQLEFGFFWVEHLLLAGYFCALIMLRSLSDIAGQQSNHGKEAQCMQTILIATAFFFAIGNVHSWDVVMWDGRMIQMQKYHFNFRYLKPVIGFSILEVAASICKSPAVQLFMQCAC